MTPLGIGQDKADEGRQDVKGVRNLRRCLRPTTLHMQGSSTITPCMFNGQDWRLCHVRSTLTTLASVV